jgi:DNA-binding NarL/FixJ family response regulator
MKPIRIVLADDHTLVRAGIRSLLEELPDVRIVAEAGDGHQALALIEAQQPDIAVIDIAMPGLNGLEVTSRVASAFPFVRVIILSMHATEEYVLRALRAGAAGYVLKDAGPEELPLALAAVVRGETYLSPMVSQFLAEYVRRVGEQDSSSLERLTPRQREVLQLIAEGHTTQKIAQTLGIGVKTVESHRAQLMDRLDIHDIAGLVRYAIQAGLVFIDE